MNTIALRFGEHFSPEDGTIAEHQKIINRYGFVWYGKMGSSVNNNTVKMVLNNHNPMILLIRSGKTERYWATVTEIEHELPDIEYIPEYYRDIAKTVKTWFKISHFQLAEKDVMSRCTVLSSGKSLNEVSRHSMSPYFIIEYKYMK